MEEAPFWCSICGKDLQSQASLTEHETGRKHLKKAFQLDPTNTASRKRPISFSALPPIDEEELFESISHGKYENIVVLSGAGISTNAGVPDYRSQGGFFEEMMQEYTERFPEVNGSPEILFSRGFANRHPEVWKDELLPKKQSFFRGLEPTKAHQFCAYLHHRGWLKRIYTQNIDGLHLHPSLNVPPEKVVQCHGSIRQPSTLVLYGDKLSPIFSDYVRCDFDLNSKAPIDLVIVMGTSLQVAPFCGLPNMAPKGATRVLVNRHLNHCLRNFFSNTGARESVYFSNTITIGGRKNVKLQPLWTDRKSRKRWRQLLAESDCDAFVERYSHQTGEDIAPARGS